MQWKENLKIQYYGTDKLRKVLKKHEEYKKEIKNLDSRCSSRTKSPRQISKKMSNKKQTVRQTVCFKFRHKLTKQYPVRPDRGF